MKWTFPLLSSPGNSKTDSEKSGRGREYVWNFFLRVSNVNFSTTVGAFFLERMGGTLMRCNELSRAKLYGYYPSSANMQITLLVYIPGWEL
jgi:hypothetical protein